MPNDLQRKASNPKNSSWVFASAGSGKTKVLTDRVLRLLLSNTSPNKILCLTFTKVAASEMQSRINKELAKWVLCDDVEIKQKLLDLNGSLPSANEITQARTLLIKILDSESKIKVQTIHAFCQTLIKIFPFESNTVPNFELLEDGQEKLLLKQALKELLRQAQKNTRLQNLVKKINSNIHNETLFELVSKLLEKRERIDFLKEKFFGVKGIIDEIFKIFSLSETANEEDLFGNFLDRLQKSEILEMAYRLEKSSSKKNKEVATKIINFLGNTSINPKRESVTLENDQRLEFASRPLIEDFDTFQSAFLTAEQNPRKLYGEFKDTYNALINEQSLIIADFLEKRSSLKMAQESALLLEISDYILEIYLQLKKNNSFLDYNDLINKTNSLLANPDFCEWVKMKMDSSFDHILLDESQDTNHRQWNIIKALSEDFFSGLSATNQQRSIFIVGDEKQSIFSFQGSEANISAEIFSYFQKKLGTQLKKIDLNVSFRSEAKILQAVDLVFASNERQKSICKISSFHSHQAIKTKEGHVEIWPLVNKQLLSSKFDQPITLPLGTSSNKDNIKENSSSPNYAWNIDFTYEENSKEKSLFAEVIAKKIKNWIRSERLMAGCLKPIKYGDIMILLRNRTNGFLEQLIKSFHQYNIPFSSISKIRFSKSLLINDLLAAAKFSLLRDDNLNLACLLKSPFFGITEEDLLKICIRKNKEQTSVYKALEIEAKDHSKFISIKNELDLMFDQSQNLNCFEFFYFLTNQEKYRKNFLNYFGYEGTEIIDKFMLIVADFQKNRSPNLQKFLEFVEKIDPEISLSSSEKNCIRIVTIHSAKGLQAPIVIIPDCSYQFYQLAATKEKILWINDLPILCSKDQSNNKTIKDYHLTKLKEINDEYLRLLYVAMTRAESELYIGGFGESKDEKCWYEIISNSLRGLAKFTTSQEFLSANESIFDNNFCHFNSSEFVSDYEFTAPKIIEQKISLSNNKNAKKLTNKGQVKGNLIHKILEVFGKNYQQDKIWLQKIATRIIEKENFLDSAAKAEITSLIFDFLHSSYYEEIFSGKVKCEVEFADNKILGRIDLLREKENEVLIIDYKSDETLPSEIPTPYVEQLKNYQNLIRKIYPNPEIKINCAILWIRFLKIQRL